MNIDYRKDIKPTATEVIELYKDAGLPRPVDDPERIQQMYNNSNLIVSAWHDGKLVGVSRTITDFCWCSYLADLAISPEYQKHGIGKKLIELTKEYVTDQSMVLLLSVPSAMEYYPKVGMQKLDNAFIINRKQ